MAMAAQQHADTDAQTGDPVVVALTDEPWLLTLTDNTLMGCTAPQLARILWPHRRDLDYAIFAPRLLLLAALSLINSAFALLDTLLHSRRVASTRIPLSPVFIVGQPRSGTTLLHNLLSLDPRFVTPNTFQVGWPSSFLTMERFAGTFPLRSVLSTTRPMDNMPLSWTTPCEDEVATNALSGGASPYAAVNFMRAWRQYIPLLTFKSTGAADARRRWCAAFLWFCRKISCRAGAGQRLLLKSPCHTGRVSMLNALFDDTASFVLVHRDPHEMFTSSHAALIDKYYRPCAALQTFSAADSQEYILEQGRTLHEAYMKDLKALPPGRVATVAFSELVADQCGAMEDVYLQLGMEKEFESVRPLFAAHASQVSQFKQNAFESPSADAKALVERRWAAMFIDFGYKTAQ